MDATVADRHRRRARKACDRDNARRTDPRGGGRAPRRAPSPAAYPRPPARRAPRHRGGGDPALPPRCACLPHRFPRRGRLLRHLGVLDHVPPPGRGRAPRPDLARRFLGTTDPPAPPRPGRVPPGRRRGRRVRRNRLRKARAPRGSPLDDRVRGQLAPDRHIELLRRHRHRFPARAHVVAGDRGAVLSRLAPRDRRLVGVAARAAAHVGARHDRRRDHLGGPVVRPLGCRLRRAGVHGNRRARLRAADRRPRRDRGDHPLGAETRAAPRPMAGPRSPRPSSRSDWAPSAPREAATSRGARSPCLWRPSS